MSGSFSTVSENGLGAGLSEADLNFEIRSDGSHGTCDTTGGMTSDGL
jgi:hypothetical protein